MNVTRGEGRGRVGPTHRRAARPARARGGRRTTAGEGIRPASGAARDDELTTEAYGATREARDVSAAAPPGVREGRLGALGGRAKAGGNGAPNTRRVAA